MKSWNSAQYWERRFLAEDTPWQLSGATPMLEKGLSTLKSLAISPRVGGKVLCPGAGRGADAIRLAKMGYEVIAVDWSDTAVAQMRREAEVALGGSAENLQIYHADFFGVKPESVDIVFEHTFYCAIDPSRRADYVEQVAQWLEPGGILFGNFFVRSLGGLCDTGQKGPPFFSSEEELKQVLACKFKCLHLSSVGDDAPGRRGDFEWLGVFERG